MKLLKKRGQFFLVATFIIVSIIFSFGIIYNFARPLSPASQSESTHFLANSIKFEGTQIIDNGVYNNLTSVKIADNLLNMTYYYSKSYPKQGIVIIYSLPPTYSANNFKDGNLTSLSLIIPPSQANVTVDLNNMNYTFNITKGFNFFVIAQKEENDEKQIATA